MAPELPLAGAKGARDFLEIAIDVLDALVGVNEDGEYHKQEDDDHFGRNFEAEPENNQRHHRDHRHRIKRTDVNIRGPLHQGKAAHDDAKKNSNDDRKERGVEQNQKAVFHVALQFA